MKKLVSAEVRLCFVDGKGNPLPEEVTEIKGQDLEPVTMLASALSTEEPPVEWVDVAADVHQALAAIHLSFGAIQGGSLLKNLTDSMLIELDKLRAIPGVGTELERRRAGVTAVPGSGRSQRNPSVSRRK